MKTDVNLLNELKSGMTNCTSSAAVLVFYQGREGRWYRRRVLCVRLVLFNMTDLTLVFLFCSTGSSPNSATVSGNSTTSWTTCFRSELVVYCLQFYLVSPVYVIAVVKLIQKLSIACIIFYLSSLSADYQTQTGVTESFFTEGEELTNLKKQVSDLQQSRDSLQEQVRTKDEKIEKLVSVVLRSQHDFSLLSIYAAKWKIGLFKTHAQRAAKDWQRAANALSALQLIGSCFIIRWILTN